MNARFSRGSSALAALILAAFVGGIVLSVHTIAGNSPQAQPAAAGASDAKCVEEDVAKKCEEAIAQAKTSGKVVTSEKGKSAASNCVAVVKTTDPAYKSSNGFKCVGKSSQIMINDTGTLTINWQANPNIKPGTCKILACRPESIPIADTVLGKTKATCAPLESKCMNKDTLLNALKGPNAFTALRSPGGLLPGAIKPEGSDYLIPSKPLDKSTNDLLNQALGKDPNDTTGYVQLDSEGNLASPAYNQLEKLAQENPDATASGASKEATEAALKLNPDLSTSRADLVPTVKPATPGYSCDESGFCWDNKTLKPVDPLTGKPKAEVPIPKPRPQDIPSNFPPSNQPPTNSGLGGLNGLLGGLLKGLAGGLSGLLNQPPQAACTSDSNAYNAALQQYQQQMQQYNQQLQQYNYQSQIAQYQGYPPPPQPTPPTQPCYTQPTPTPTPTPTTPPTAQLSCQPETADIGMSIAITFTCGNSTSSSGGGFDTGGQTSGSATTTLDSPPAGATKATYTLQCKNSATYASAQCSVNISRPSIILVANPKIVEANASSTIGWLTTGMKECTVSSPNNQEFTSQNVTNQSVNGAAITPPLSQSMDVLLHCTTLGGNTKDATTTVQVGAPSGDGGGITVSSSADGTSVARGGSMSITWDGTASSTADSAVSLWLYDIGLDTSVALVARNLDAAGTYTWDIPAANVPCPADSPYACSADLVPGNSYSIEAAIYTPVDAYLGGYPPANPVSPTYLGSGTSGTFTVSS